MAARGRGAGPSDAEAPSDHASEIRQAVLVEGPGSEGWTGRGGGGGAGTAPAQAVPAGAAGPQRLRMGGQWAPPVVVARVLRKRRREALKTLLLLPLQMAACTHHSFLLQVRSAQGNDAVLPGTESKRHRLTVNQCWRQVQVSVWGQGTDLRVCLGRQGGRKVRRNSDFREEKQRQTPAASFLLLTDKQ